MSIQERIDEMKVLLDSCQIEVDKLDNKDIKSAGVPIRKMLQEIKNKAQDARVAVNEVVKAPKKPKE